jgi:hypothetical protein
VSMPIIAAVLVSVASRREESARSLCEPAQGIVQAAARRIVGFHSQEPGWPLPKSRDQLRSGAPALRSVSQPRNSLGPDSPRRAAASKVSIRTAA